MGAGGPPNAESASSLLRGLDRGAAPDGLHDHRVDHREPFRPVRWLVAVDRWLVRRDLDLERQ
jgi:hypothetical protein